jgi:hypothetical protein
VSNKKTKPLKFIKNKLGEDQSTSIFTRVKKVIPQPSFYRNEPIIPDNDSDDKFLVKNIFG